MSQRRKRGQGNSQLLAVGSLGRREGPFLWQPSIYSLFYALVCVNVECRKERKKISNVYTGSECSIVLVTSRRCSKTKSRIHEIGNCWVKAFILTRIETAI